jgi:pyruvate ferredoxin oxidoreductase alpha subunit
VVQLFAENAQEAYDLTVMAPRLAEHPDVLLPVLVCQDGFTITHSAEPVAVLPDEAVAEFVGDYRIPHSVLDVRHPTTQGPFAMPDYYYELRRAQACALETAAGVFEEVAGEFEELSGRVYGTLERYRLEGARRAFVALGSSAGTIKDVVDDERDAGDPLGLVKLTSFRPFPSEPLRDALSDFDDVIVLDRADSPGGVAPLHAEVAAVLYGERPQLHGHVYGLGGRDLHPADVREILSGDASVYVGLRGERCPA